MNQNRELERYINLLYKLTRCEIKPSIIVGTGYKNSREVAYGYLAEMIAKEYNNGLINTHT